MFGKYKVAHLLGTTKNNELRFRSVEIALTKAGYICFRPAIYDFEIYKQHADLLDDMCYEKLLVCDFCVLVTTEHIGESTAKRIEQSNKLNKPVFLWDDKTISRIQSWEKGETNP